MRRKMKIAIGGDHGGFELKQDLLAYALTKGHQVRDCGTHGKNPVDYPKIALEVARFVASGDCQIGIVIDGAGIGSAMAANKVPGILAAACYNEALARNSREHNGANVLSLGSGQTSLYEAKKIVDAFLQNDCTVERHQRRVQMIRDIEKGNLAASRISAQAGQDIHPQDLERIYRRARELTSGRAGGNFPSANGGGFNIGPNEIAQMIDHTILKPEASLGDVQKLCEEAREHNFYSVCVNPTYARQAKAALVGTNVKICCVVGFPLGANPPESKAMEARRAIREGAKEIDMVINVGAMKSGNEDLVLKDIRAVSEACRDGSAILKVILETSLLTDLEKVRVCELAMKAGANFVKTSTGFGSAGATTEDISLMARTVATKKLGVKASGGVRTYEDAVKMIQAGATRIGASSGINIVKKAKELASN